MFWALAVPERLARSAPIGVLIGTALVNAAALAIVGLVALRLLGPRAARSPSGRFDSSSEPAACNALASARTACMAG